MLKVVLIMRLMRMMMNISLSQWLYTRCISISIKYRRSKKTTMYGQHTPRAINVHNLKGVYREEDGADPPQLFPEAKIVGTNS